MEFEDFENDLKDVSLDSDFDILNVMKTFNRNGGVDIDDDSINVVDAFIEFYLRHNTSLVCLEDAMKIYNFNRPVSDKLPTAKKQILRLFSDHRELFEVFYFVKCSKCSKRLKLTSGEKKLCCGQNLQKTETNFFVQLAIKKQLEKSIRENWSYIKEFETSSNHNGSYSDARDGKILKEVLTKYEDDDVNILSLCMNVDGAKKFKSNRLSLWPIQFTQNFLPPKIRFLPKNIIIAGLFYTDSDDKLHFREFMLPLIMELNGCASNFISMMIEESSYEFKPIITHCSVDLPAKGKLQETIQFGGYMACTYCDIKGEMVIIKLSKGKKGKKESQEFVRYVESATEPNLRDPIETWKKMLAAARSKNAMDGIKDVSALVALEHFNILWSVGVEYMHCCLLGVQKRIINLLVDPKNKLNRFYMNANKRRMLNNRLLAIKPNAEIVRKPRSLEQKSLFKASEFRYLLLYYLPVCLEGCVPKIIVSHIRSLSDAVYILLKKNITNEEVDAAERMLKEFVKEHQSLFGKENMVMNIHLLKHLAESVRQLGPLWCFSAFPFERNNGILLKMVNGTSQVLLQISSKYNLSKSTTREYKKPNEIQKNLLGRSVAMNEKSLRVVNIENSKEIDLSNVNLMVHKRIRKDGKIFTSKLYTRPKKSIDYVVGLRNGLIGMAMFYVEVIDKIYVVIEELERSDDRRHVWEVECTQNKYVAPIDDIEFKYIYMKVGLRQYVSALPNPYEKE